MFPQISCSGGKRGIYLRESRQLCKPFSESVSVTTVYNEDVGEYRELMQFVSGQQFCALKYIDVYSVLIVVMFYSIFPIS